MKDQLSIFRDDVPLHMEAIGVIEGNAVRLLTPEEMEQVIDQVIYQVMEAEKDAASQ